MKHAREKSVVESSRRISASRLARRILELRGRRVIIDADLAVLYGVTTKALNQAVKRNSDRFPEEFMFVLDAGEKLEVVTICDHLKQLKFSRTQPTAFTEHGAIMVATVLKTKRAVEMSVFVVRAFVELRESRGLSRGGLVPEPAVTNTDRWRYASRGFLSAFPWLPFRRR